MSTCVVQYKNNTRRRTLSQSHKFQAIEALWSVRETRDSLLPTAQLEGSLFQRLVLICFSDWFFLATFTLDTQTLHHKAECLPETEQRTGVLI